MYTCTLWKWGKNMRRFPKMASLSSSSSSMDTSSCLLIPIRSLPSKNIILKQDNISDPDPHWFWSAGSPGPHWDSDPAGQKRPTKKLRNSFLKCCMLYIHTRQCFGSGSALILACWIRTGNADPDPHWKCGSGSSRAKVTHKNRKKLRKVHV